MDEDEAPEPEPEDAVALQGAIDDAIRDLDQRPASRVSSERLHRLETLLCNKLDNGLGLTIRERDLLDHVDVVRSSRFTLLQRGPLVPVLLCLLALGLVIYLIVTWS